MKTNPNNILAVSLLAAGTLVFTLLVGIKVRHHRLVLGDQTKRHADTHARVLEEWKRCKYTPIGITNLEQEVLKHVRQETRCELSGLQNKELQSALVRMFRAFTQGGYDSYMDFLRPVPVTPNQKRITIIRNSLEGNKQKFSASDFPVPNELKGKVSVVTPPRSLKDVIIAPRDLDQLIKIHFERASGHTQFTGWWHQVCIARSFVLVETAKTMPEPFAQAIDSNSADYGTNYWGISDFSAMPIYRYSGAPDEILASDGMITFASTGWLIALKDPDPPTPFLIRFYWNSKHERWVVWELLLGNMELVSKITPVF